MALNEAVMDIIIHIWDMYPDEFLEVVENAGWHLCEDCEERVTKEGWCL